MPFDIDVASDAPAGGPYLLGLLALAIEWADVAFWVQCLLAGLILALSLGSLLALSKSSHWFVRGWEYPRIQIATMLAAFAVAFSLLHLLGGDWSLWDTLLLVLAGSVAAWHIVRIYVFTPIATRQVIDDDPALKGHGETIRVITSNVEMENTAYDRFIAMVTEEKPDVVIALETDQNWVDGLAPLRDHFKHFIDIPQDNWYGMVLMTNLELVDHDVRFIVQDDIPSIHARLRAGDHCEFVLRCLHPRPPEPIRGTHATSRDAELVVVGREIEESDEATIVTGDLNDVAWSHTTRLFLRLSEMLDPRRGRGLFTTWPVDHPFWRVPLDHVFHSEHFTFANLRRLPDIGSDHFPICADLVWRASAELHQEPVAAYHDDEDEAQNKIDEAEEVNERKVRSPNRQLMSMLSRVGLSLDKSNRSGAPNEPLAAPRRPGAAT